MKSKMLSAVMAAGILLTIGLGCQQGACKAKVKWAVHDKNRPQPRVVTPGQPVGQPPSDAIVLFNGKDLAAWQDAKGNPAAWKVENGYMEIVAKTGDLKTRQAFGDCQLHIEWATPTEVKGEGQHPGNSGVFLMGLYEVQVLDSYKKITYADGQAGAMYGQNPPMVNASLPPGQWQSYDIVFHHPKFSKNGKVLCPARISVWHNGIIVQDNFKIVGATVHGKEAVYKAHAEKLPLSLQDHSCLVRYRNIWIRELD